MAKIIWVTPTGTVANLLIGIPISVELMATEQGNPDAPITYTVIGGSLPPGLTMSSAGVISGTPIYSVSADNYFTTATYSFTVRASNGIGAVLDNGFNIIITNIVNGDFSWVTPAGNLGTIPNTQYYSKQLQAESDNASTITYSLISGELPTGIQLTSAGLLTGVPTFLQSFIIDTSVTYKFTVRATTNLGHINDRTFSLTATDTDVPTIFPEASGRYNLGIYFDGSYYSQQLGSAEDNPNVILTWSVKSGTLPSGITLSNTGLLSGYIQPLQLVGDFGPAGYDGDVTSGGVITQQHEYDYGPYDFDQLNQSLNYNFIIQVSDGVNFDLQEYTIEIISRVGFTADSTNFVNDNYLTVDSENVYIPVLLNSSTTLPTGRQNSYYAFKFDGFDFAGDPIIYGLANTAGTFDAYVLGADEGFDYTYFDSFDPNTSSTTALPGLLLDAQTGWLYGKINPQTASLIDYRFGIVVSKVVDGITYSSNPVYFTLPVLGNVNDVIEWITPSNLGTISNGQVSELVLEAKSIVGKPLVYTLYDHAGVQARLPQGLTLLSDGTISGRVTFEAFTIDDYTTTFDSEKLTIDRSYTFTVEVATTDSSANTFQEFTLLLNIIDTEPYENLYLKAMPALDQRAIYTSVVNNNEIFDPNLIYRPEDPWFGVQQDISMLFLPGLNTKTLDEYELAIARNHWTKRYNFGDVKTAVVLDNYYNVKYEVVYINVVDPELNSNNQGPGLELNLTNVIENPYIDAEGNEYKILYPNTSENMIKRMVAGPGFNDQSSLPPWMTSNQPSSTAGMFNPPLGYTKAVVLAYTIPGASKLIAYRLRNSGINFNSIEFSVDRYLVDNYYSQYYDQTTGTYIRGRETTFDRTPNTNVGVIVAKVTYAVTVPFNQINGRPVTYINARDGIDGRTDYTDGDTIVFVKQEQFINPGPYDGWVNYQDSFLGDNVTTPSIEGYDSEGWDLYNVIPGYLEKSQGSSTVNQRGSVWQIAIVNGIVTLTSILEILPNQRVSIIAGKSYSSSILYYNPILSVGQTVPFYSIVKLGQNALKVPTTFNGDSTKFFSYRDQYYAPGSQDKYLKFPQYGVFN